MKAMGNPVDNDSHGWMETLSKFLAWLAYITLGVVARIAVDSRTVVLTWKQITIKVVLSVFVGAVACFACETFNYSKMIPVIVPVATLLGEAIALQLVTNGWDWIVSYFPWLKKKKRNNDNLSTS